MPLYEYRCNDCGSLYEMLRPMEARNESAECPDCQSQESMPLISRAFVRGGESGRASEPSAPVGGGGGCCGGGCGCN